MQMEPHFWGRIGKHHSELTIHRRRTLLVIKTLCYVILYSVNCQMSSTNVHLNLIPIDQNVRLQTLYEPLIQTYTNSNRA